MAPYHHRVNTHHKSKRARKIKKFTFITALVLFVGASIIVIDWLLIRSKSDDSVVSERSTTAVQSATVNIFRTPYFQFQTDSKWAEEAEASTETKFVYKRFNESLVEHQLTVYVNETAPSKFAATRIFPVELIKGIFSKVADVSAHCNTALPETSLKNEPEIVTLGQVTFNCDAGSSTYRVFVGVVGGTNSINAVRPNGEKATYTIIYDDLTYLPSANQINSIMSTFQIR